MRFLTLLAVSDPGPRTSEVLANVKLKTLSLDDAREILRLYPAPPEPITVTPTGPNK